MSLTKMFKELLTQLIKTVEQLCLPDLHASHLRQMSLAHFSCMTAYMSNRIYIGVWWVDQGKIQPQLKGRKIKKTDFLVYLARVNAQNN